MFHFLVQREIGQFSIIFVYTGFIRIYSQHKSVAYDVHQKDYQGYFLYKAIHSC